MHGHSLITFISNMTGLIFTHSTFLKHLYYAQPREREFLIEGILPNQIRAISYLAERILNGSLTINRIHQYKLRQYKNTIRVLANQRISVRRKKQTLIAYHKLLPLLIKPILHLLEEQ